MADDGENDRPPSKPNAAPILNYPSPPSPDELDSEPWPQVIRAMLVVFGIMGAGFLILFGFCGVLRGC